MLNRVISWSVRNPLLVLLGAAAAALVGIWALERTPLDALPDLSDVQVIVQADYDGQAPRIVEDQVTYPVAAEMLKVPGAKTVRGYSFFGVSFVYVIFEDGTDLYWARSRVLEYLSGIKAKLPASVTPMLGPDATGLGWVYQYALEDTSGRMSIADLRSLQDWNIRYALTGVPGVSEVGLGGWIREAVSGGRGSHEAARLRHSHHAGDERHPRREQRRRRDGDGAVGAREHGARAGLPEVRGRHRERGRRRHGERHADHGARRGPRDRGPRGAARALPISTAAATPWAAS